jgi:hypothetical protein
MKTRLKELWDRELEASPGEMAGLEGLIQGRQRLALGSA